eukprot:1550865-Rhodomonas_salina.12
MSGPEIDSASRMSSRFEKPDASNAWEKNQQSSLFPFDFVVSLLAVVVVSSPLLSSVSTLLSLHEDDAFLRLTSVAVYAATRQRQHVTGSVPPKVYYTPWIWYRPTRPLRIIRY